MQNLWVWATFWFKVLLRFVAYIAGFALAFRFIFQFSNLQALGLGLTLAVAIDIAASRKTHRTFRPYLVRVFPELRLMLTDLGLATDDELRTVVKDVASFRPWTDDHIFHYGVRAFVISHEPESMNDVIHFPDVGFYSTRLEIDIKIDVLKISGTYREWSPEFFMGLSSGGYAFGIRVTEEWWKENQGRVAPGVVVDENHEYNFGRVRLALAVLPYQVKSEFYIPMGRGHQDALKKLIAPKGWTNEPRGGGEVPYYGEEYRHKYVTVSTGDIDV